MQQMRAGSCPNWWNINNKMRPPPNYYPHQFPNNPSTSLVIPPNSVFTPQYMPPSSSSSSSSCHENQDQLPESWSQLLLGGVVGEEDKSCMSPTIQDKKLRNWEEKILQHQAAKELVKQEDSTTNYVYGHGDLDNYHDQYQALAIPSWSQMVPCSSPKSSCITTTSNLSTNMLDFSNKKADGKRSLGGRSYECNSTVTGGAFKKTRVQTSSSSSTIKVRKEKLGDKINALHQLVSPFGKTDTASVLLEVIGYIRFLQNQVEALSLPYLSNEGGNTTLQQSVNGENNCLFREDSAQESNEELMKKDLTSRGLCLVPLSCTYQVEGDNCADYWAPSLEVAGFR